MAFILRFGQFQQARFFQGRHAARQVDGVAEAGGLQLAQGLVGAHPGVAHHQEALVRGDFVEAAVQGLLGDVQPALAEQVHVGRGVLRPPDVQADGVVGLVRQETLLEFSHIDIFIQAIQGVLGGVGYGVDDVQGRGEGRGVGHLQVGEI